MSCSTSLVQGSIAPLDMEWNRQNAAKGLPELIYPVPVVVRNTFIDAPSLRRSESLEEFLKERQAYSCPASSQHLEHEEDASHELRRTSSGWAAGIQAMSNWWRPSTPDFPAANEEERNVQLEGRDTVRSEQQRPTQEVQRWAERQPGSVGLSESASTLGQLAVGSPGVPTVGSAGHDLGECKPCAFFHTRGCQSGAQCLFCHLCDAGEKKLRKKEKLTARREARRLRQERNATQTAPLGNWLPNISYCWS